MANQNQKNSWQKYKHRGRSEILIGTEQEDAALKSAWVRNYLELADLMIKRNSHVANNGRTLALVGSQAKTA
jgi:hypothetical protein